MSGIYINKNGSLNNILIYRKTSNGMEICPVYKKTFNGMERIDLGNGSSGGGGSTPSSPYIVKGYADWSGSYRGSSTTGTFTDNFNDDRRDRIYQGYYPNFNYLGIICFKSLFEQARQLGTISSVKLKLTNLHSYYYAGLNTIISGATNMSTYRPTSFSMSNVNSTQYCSSTHFNKGGTLTLTLNSTAIQSIQNGTIDGFRLLAPTGFAVTDYGYFSGTGSTRPYIEITIAL